MSGNRKARVGAVAATVALALLCALAAGLAQATPVHVNVRVEGRSKTLFEGPILSEGHAVGSYRAAGGSAAEDLAEHPCDGINPLDPENTSPGPTPTAAAVDAMATIGEAQAMAGQWYPGFEDYFVKQWGGEAENAEAEGRSWGILANNVFTNVGGCQYELDEGDEVLWVYNAFAFRPLLALFAADAHYSGGERPLTATASLGVPFEVEVLAYPDSAESSPPAHPERTGAEPLDGAAVAPVSTSARGAQTLELESAEAVTTNAEGRAQIMFATPGWHRLKAGAVIDQQTHEEEAIRSNRLDVCVLASDESGCGAPPGEDELRVPPRYLSPPGKPGNGEAPPSAPGGGPLAPTGSDSAGATTPGAGAAAGVAQALATRASSPPARLELRSVDAHRLLLSTSIPGTITVRLARRVRVGRRTRWRMVKTLVAKAAKAGRLTVGLPHLGPGHYRASIALGAARPVVEAFVIRRGH